MITSTHEPFLLEWDLSDLGDENFFAYLVEFPGHENIVALASTKSYELPERVFFTGNLQKLKSLDYPYNNALWPLMSGEMISVLTGVGQFAFHKIPVTMLDDTIPQSELFVKQGKPKPEYMLERFNGVQLLDHLDAFDWEHSVYERDKYITNRVVSVTRLVVKDVPNRFPPLFRLSACPTLLFVSAEARRALENEKVSGVAFVAISDYPHEKIKN